MPGVTCAMRGLSVPESPEIGLLQKLERVLVLHQAHSGMEGHVSTGLLSECHSQESCLSH